MAFWDFEHLIFLMQKTQCPATVLLVQVLSADAVAFGAAISTCGNCGQWEYALHVFSEMHGQMQPDVVACNAVISACEKCEKWQQACFLLAEITAFESGSQWQMAWQLLWDRERGDDCDVPSRPVILLFVVNA